jgi:hypothetical protein
MSRSKRFVVISAVGFGLVFFGFSTVHADGHLAGEMKAGAEKGMDDAREGGDMMEADAEKGLDETEKGADSGEKEMDDAMDKTGDAMEKAGHDM